MKKTIFLTLLVLLLILVGFFGLKGKKIIQQKPTEIEKPQEKNIELSVLDVYLSESEKPDTVYLNMRVKWQPAKGIGAPSCDIYFPPQEGMEQGTGPIEGGCNFIEPIGEERE
ncbi:MAG: hypothetical protein ACK413_03600, partial [Patescibacteria group bacterium]